MASATPALHLFDGDGSLAGYVISVRGRIYVGFVEEFHARVDLPGVFAQLFGLYPREIRVLSDNIGGAWIGGAASSMPLTRFHIGPLPSPANEDTHG